MNIRVGVDERTAQLYVLLVFQWRGSHDAIVWSPWHTLEPLEVDRAAVFYETEGYTYVQARTLADGVEIRRSPIEVWDTI